MTRQKSSYHVMVFGIAEGAEDIHSFPGEIFEFETKRELDSWLNAYSMRVHKKDYLAGQCMLQLPDGRAVMIIKGCRKILKTTVELS